MWEWKKPKKFENGKIWKFTSQWCKFETKMNCDSTKHLIANKTVYV